MNAPERFLAACARRPVDRTPVWLMRQAGRYLPEYRAIREKVDFLTLCKTPDLAAEVSLQPLERFMPDVCIIFSDILIPVEAMGCPVEFGEGGPRLAKPVRSAADIEKLKVPDPESDTPFVMETIRRVRRALGDKAALVGFTGAPYTLASYMMEGAGSKNFSTAKALMYSDPPMVRALLGKLADTVGAYAAAQVAAGAQAIQVFDTWAGELEPHAYEQFAMPYQAAVIKRIKSTGVPAILFVNGCAGIIERMAMTGADVLSIDWRLDLGDARIRTGDRLGLQGNVDPSVLLSTPDAVVTTARAAMAAGGPVGHILNLGHGVLPTTPIENVRAFVDAAKNATGPAQPVQNTNG